MLDTHHSDFLLGCAAAIPVLALAILLETQVASPPPGWVRSLSSRQILVGRLVATFVLLEVAFSAGYAEWFCLRSLELGRFIGDTWGCWSTLGQLTTILVMALLANIWIPSE